MSSWLVTGARGFLGSNAGLFLRDKTETVGQVRRGAAPAIFTASAEAELTDGVSICELVKRTRPSVIFHSAAMASHELCEQDPAGAMLVNATATSSLALAAASVGALMIYVSTDAVFDGARGSYEEADETNPFSVYGRTKLAGELAVRAASENHIILRTNFFGWSPSGTRSILEFFVNGFRRHDTMKGYTDFTVTSIYAQHLLSVTADLVKHGATGTFHIASRDALSKYDFGYAVSRAFGFDASLLVPSLAASADHPTSRSRNLSLSTNKVESLLGHELPSQAEGLSSAYDDEVDLTRRLRGTGAGA